MPILENDAAILYSCPLLNLRAIVALYAKL
jgi:hypothetical protein